MLCGWADNGSRTESWPGLTPVVVRMASPNTVLYEHLDRYGDPGVGRAHDVFFEQCLRVGPLLRILLVEGCRQGHAGAAQLLVMNEMFVLSLRADWDDSNYGDSTARGGRDRERPGSVVASGEAPVDAATGQRHDMPMFERFGAITLAALVAFGCTTPPVGDARAPGMAKARTAPIASALALPVASTVVPAAVKREPPLSCYVLPSQVESLATRPYAALEIHEGAESQSATRCKLATRKLRRDELTEVHCFEGLAGEEAVWGVIVRNPTNYGERPSWQLFYQTDTWGVKSKWNEAVGSLPSAAMPVAVFDLDADGRSEAVTLVRAFTDAAASPFNTVEVWSAGRKAIEPFPAVVGHRLIDVRDVDGDGRPEFVEDPYDVQLGTSLSGKREAQVEWSSLLEITGRTTSKNDGDLARNFAREICPSGENLLGFLAEVPEHCVAHVAHCAAVWGIPAADTHAALERYCTGDRAHPDGWCAESLALWKLIAQGRALLP
jgi:hypothetical protein